jgi:glycosyltransferase involved in cell wall biosynthesis
MLRGTKQEQWRGRRAKQHLLLLKLRAPWQRHRMISVIIPTLNAEELLPATLTALVPAALEGLVREVIVVDGGSTDRTGQIADHTGAELISAPPNRGAQLRAGAHAARHPWLLFLDADTVLASGWEREADSFMDRVDRGASRHSAAAFSFAIDDDGFAPRALEWLVYLKCAVLHLPSGGQGLLISRRRYDEVGGHRPLAMMEDVDLLRRIGPRRVKLLSARAVSDAARYRRDGYIRATLGNLAQRIRYALNLAPAQAAELGGER